MTIKHLLFLLLIIPNTYAQNYEPGIRNITNDLNGISKLIEIDEYQKIEQISEKYIEITPVAEKGIIIKYPEIFKKIDSCYTFKKDLSIKIADHHNELKACNKKGNDRKEYGAYRFKGVYNNHALIEIKSYESWGFISVSLKDGSAFYTMGIPLFSNDETVISYSNYYGEEEIALTDLKTRKQYVIGIEGWRTIASRSYKNSYYLKLKSEFLQDCPEEISYLKVEIESKK